MSDPSRAAALAAGTQTSAGPETVLSVEGLTKRYGSLVAVDGISFQVRRGETFGMLGPNGAGGARGQLHPPDPPEQHSARGG